MASYVVGLTGGVASGKSTVSALFESMGVVIADADLAARAVVAPGQPALAEIARRFGPGFLLANGMLNRVRMRELVFEDPAARADLEAITHPRIRDIVRSTCLCATTTYAIAAIPLLAESGVAAAYDWLDRTLVVDCQVAQQLDRLIRRDGVGTDLATRMVRSQASREDRLAIATDVVVNDAGPEVLQPAVERLDRVFRRLAAYPKK